MGLSLSDAAQLLSVQGLRGRYGRTVCAGLTSNAAVSGPVTLPPVSAIPQVVVPSVTGIALVTAKNSLTALGLTWSVTETIDDTHAPGTVLTQSPAAGP